MNGCGPQKPMLLTGSFILKQCRLCHLTGIASLAWVIRIQFKASPTLTVAFIADVTMVLLTHPKRIIHTQYQLTKSTYIK